MCRVLRDASCGGEAAAGCVVRGGGDTLGTVDHLILRRSTRASALRSIVRVERGEVTQTRQQSPECRDSEIAEISDTTCA